MEQNEFKYARYKIRIKAALAESCLLEMGDWIWRIAVRVSRQINVTVSFPGQNSAEIITESLTASSFPVWSAIFQRDRHMSRSRNRADNRQNSYSRQERYLCSVLRPNGICNPRPNSLIYEDSNAISAQMQVFVLHIRVFFPPFFLNQITLLHFVTLIKSPHERKNS